MGEWDINSATFQKSISAQDSNPQGLAWKSDGTKLYEIGLGSDKIYEYDVSTAWDIETATFQTSINTQGTAPFGLAWKSDGTKLYEVDRSSNNISEYDVSTAWDITAATFQTSINTQDDESYGIAWKSDGTKLYEIGAFSSKIYEYDVSTAWDITAATFQTSINTQDSVPNGLAWKSDGTKLYEIGSNSDKFYEYDVSTAWDITTATFQTSASTQSSDPTGLAWKSDGTKLYEIGEFSDTIYQYTTIQSLSSPTQTWTWDHPTASLTSAGTSTVAAPVQTWQWAALAASELGYTLASPTQGWTWDQPTASLTVSGTATIADSGTVWTWSLPAAAVLDDEWRIDGAEILDVVDETATDTTLAVTIRAETTELTTTLRPLKSDEGKVNLLRTDDGGYVAVDRANGDNTYYIQPPIRRSPLRRAGDVHVRRYEEQLVSQDVEEWDVDLELVRSANRSDAPSISETVATDEWGFTTQFGTIATDRVRAEFQGTGEGGVERYELIATLTFDEAHTFEAALSRLGGTRIRDIPDGDNVAVDDTDSTVGTLTIDVPANQDGISDGDFVVLDFESTRLSEAAQEVTVTVATT